MVTSTAKKETKRLKNFYIRRIITMLSTVSTSLVNILASLQTQATNIGYSIYHKTSEAFIKCFDTFKKLFHKT